jgi:hypothetical protein
LLRILLTTDFEKPLSVAEFVPSSKPEDKKGMPGSNHKNMLEAEEMAEGYVFSANHDH